jgi:serine-type D-Ala-D-Ala carboxypeptidase (penicillin-binding protein 5/6)
VRRCVKVVFNVDPISKSMKKFKYITACTLVTVFFLMCAAPSVEAKKRQKKPGPYKVSARAALLVEGDNWPKKLYDKDSSRAVFPASTTKVMTALIVMEHLPMNRVITVGKSVVNVLPTKIDLKPGEKYKVSELLYAALLKSANDASVVLAEAVAGSESKFVELMNKRAKQLGAKQTLFANAHGLPSDDPQYTTASDMIMIFREALKKPFFRDAISQRVRTITSEEGRKIVLHSHNKALFKGWKENIFGKTGYTRAAQSCFVGYLKKGKRKIYIAVFGCSQRWDDVKYLFERRAGIDL